MAARLRAAGSRRLAAAGRGWSLDYLGPPTWRDQALLKELRAPGELVEEAEALLSEVPFEQPRREMGAGTGPPEMVRECLGVEVGWVDCQVVTGSGILGCWLASR